jgi:O-antigen ligase
VAGVLYNVFEPKNLSRAVKILSVVGIGLFLALTNPDYWKRIETIKLQGQDIEGVDTGGGRLEIIQAQWKISKSHPMGCGHMCTTTLSNRYLEDRFLFGGGRASHNTFMTMLVDHGLPGAMFYVLWVMWTVRWTLRLRRRVASQGPFLAVLLPAVAASLGAIIIGDLFVQYPKLEVRFWLIGLMLVMIRMTDTTTSGASEQRSGEPDGTLTARSDGLADHESRR